MLILMYMHKNNKQKINRMKLIVYKDNYKFLKENLKNMKVMIMMMKIYWKKNLLNLKENKNKKLKKIIIKMIERLQDILMLLMM